MAALRWLAIFVGTLVLAPVVVAVFMAGFVLSIPGLLVASCLPDRWAGLVLRCTPVGWLAERWDA